MPTVFRFFLVVSHSLVLENACYGDQVWPRIALKYAEHLESLIPGIIRTGALPSLPILSIFGRHELTHVQWSLLTRVDRQGVASPLWTVKKLLVLYRSAVSEV